MRGYGKLGGGTENLGYARSSRPASEAISGTWPRPLLLYCSLARVRVVCYGVVGRPDRSSASPTTYQSEPPAGAQSTCTSQSLPLMLSQSQLLLSVTDCGLRGIVVAQMLDLGSSTGVHTHLVPAVAPVGIRPHNSDVGL